MNSTLGLVFSNMHEHLVGELAANRCMGSIPIGGRYRLIDFALSSLTNSGVESVGVITKSNYQSLMDHLGSGREWDLSRKHGGLVILPPFGRSESGMYRGRVDALAGIMAYINSTGAEYVLTLDCDMIANIDFRPFLEAHKQSGADISVMYKQTTLTGKTNKDQSVFSLDGDGFVEDMRINPQITGNQSVYMNIMILRRELLEQLVNDCYSRSLFSFEKEVLQRMTGQKKIFAYSFEGYVSRFDSLRSYFSTNIALLEPDVRKTLFPHNRPIYTKVRDDAPVRYGLDARVRGSLVADGCLIEGEVENSVLFRGVTVEKGVHIKNSILMQGTHVGAQSSLDYVITDKNVVIKESRMLMGFETYPVYIAKGSLV